MVIQIIGGLEAFVNSSFKKKSKKEKENLEFLAFF